MIALHNSRYIVYFEKQMKYNIRQKNCWLAPAPNKCPQHILQQCAPHPWHCPVIVNTVSKQGSAMDTDNEEGEVSEHSEVGGGAARTSLEEARHRGGG